MTKEKEFLTIKEFAKLVGVHHHTVRKSIKNGYICAFRLNPGYKSAYRIPRSELNKLALFDMEKVIKNLIDEKLNEH